MREKRNRLGPAMAFILLLGVVSLFSDMTHEAAAGIRGDYLALLGASAATIGFVSGLGELVGYSLRIVFGRLTDRTGRYWLMTIAGYAIDVFAVPALALVREDGWIWACALIILERTGKAVKKPAKNTLLSFAASQEGVGRSFAIQEAIDQCGAVLGPLLLFAVLTLKSGTEYERYVSCFTVLTVPAVLTIGFLLLARRKFPHPERFEPEPAERERFRMRPSFMLYLAAIGLFAFGFIDFSLITMHVARAGLFTTRQLPLLYAGTMLVDALSALVFGRLYDRRGFLALVLSTLLSCGFSILVFGSGARAAVIAGVLLWGLGMGAQESILKAAVSSMVPKSGRAAGFGVFECAFGVCWFLGSWLMGALYDRSLPALIAVSAGAQLLAVPFYLLSASRQQRGE